MYNISVVLTGEISTQVSVDVVNENRKYHHYQSYYMIVYLAC